MVYASSLEPNSNQEGDYELLYDDESTPKTGSKTDLFVDDDYYSVQEEPAENKADPRDYCKLTINAMVFPLKRFRNTSSQIKIHAYFGDDLSFECAVPEQFLESPIVWLMNGTALDVDENFFNLAVDKQMVNNLTTLLISSSFKLKNQPHRQLVQFPVIVFGRWFFVGFLRFY